MLKNGDKPQKDTYGCHPSENEHIAGASPGVLKQAAIAGNINISRTTGKPASGAHGTRPKRASLKGRAASGNKDSSSLETSAR